jgi:hypothetical protein
MGQPVTVIEKPSSTPGVVRYEINRTITGMGHETYRSADDAYGPRPCDELARRLFARGGIETVHMNANIITVHLLDASPPQGIKEVIETMYIYYGPGVEVVWPEGASAE